jgi:hypothetical protein
MAVADFAARAVHDFVEQADDEGWFQLFTIIRVVNPQKRTLTEPDLETVICPGAKDALGVSSDPSQNRLDCSDAWIFRLTRNSKANDPWRARRIRYGCSGRRDRHKKRI